eukprot:gene6214-2830_t
MNTTTDQHKRIPGVGLQERRRKQEHRASWSSLQGTGCAKTPRRLSMPSLDIFRQNQNTQKRTLWDAMALEWKCRNEDKRYPQGRCAVNLDDVSPIRRTCPPECTSSRNINWLFGGIDSKLGRVQARIAVQLDFSEP